MKRAELKENIAIGIGLWVIEARKANKTIITPVTADAITNPHRCRLYIPKQEAKSRREKRLAENKEGTLPVL